MRTKLIHRLAVVGLLLCAAGVLMLGACSATGGKTDEGAATQPTAAATPKGGAQLWAENCARCHNSRSPSSYSDAQWDVAVHHMRLRVPLNGQDTAAIVEFLKSANNAN